MDMKFVNTPRSILGALRKLTPQRDVSFTEALRLAEIQAARLLELSDVTTAPVPDEIVLSLPRIERRYHQLRAASGMTYWNGSTWIIGINRDEPRTRQRFTLLHELKHIIDHHDTGRLYRGDEFRTAERQAELAADYFAGCVLVSKLQLRRAWYGGEQRVDQLARGFEVSTKAMEVRLNQAGLREDLVVEERPDFRPRLPKRPAEWYYRSADISTNLHQTGVTHV